jgi:hypothetical protein
MTGVSFLGRGVNPAGNPPAPGFDPFTADNLSVADFTACYCP